MQLLYSKSILFLGHILHLIRYSHTLHIPKFSSERLPQNRGVRLHAESKTETNVDYNSQLLPQSAYETILQGRVAVIPDFLPSALVNNLRSDAQTLHREGYFSTDALAAYGKEKTTKFDPSKDRTVLKLDQWKRTDIGDVNLRHSIFASKIEQLRTDLSINLNRPGLRQGLSTTKYGKGSTEISYTRFGPGAYLKRHIDEHHEELKGKRGWEKPTRRSVTWLIYLNGQDWDPNVHAGFLRCFQRRIKPIPNVEIGSTSTGDLQIGWLRASTNDPVERPVFLDGRCPGSKGNCALYTFLEKPKPVYISKPFDPNPILFLSGGDFFAKRLLIDNPILAPRFHFLEPPKSAITDIMSPPQTPSNPWDDETVLDVPPLGGTLVVFDSVSLPHEVLSSKGRERWAASGWFHEDQQKEIPTTFS